MRCTVATAAVILAVGCNIKDLKNVDPPPPLVPETVQFLDPATDIAGPDFFGSPDPGQPPTDLGQPDVFVPPIDVAPSVDSGPDAGSPDLPVVPDDLCWPCLESSECGGADDACVLYSDDEEQGFCAMPCDESAPCPDGYSCEILYEPSEMRFLFQCKSLDSCGG